MWVVGWGRGVKSLCLVGFEPGFAKQLMDKPSRAYRLGPRFEPAPRRPSALGFPPDYCLSLLKTASSLSIDSG